MPEPSRVQVVLAHHERAVVRSGDIFIKIDANADRLWRETQALGCVDVPVPEVLWSRDEPAMLALAGLAGRPLSGDDPPGTWAGVGEVVQQLHATRLPDWIGEPMTASGVEYWIELENRWVRSNTELDASVIDRAVRSSRRLIDGMETLRPVFRHGDLQADHVFVDDGHVTGLLDWSDVSAGDGAYDLAVLTSTAKHHLPSLLEGYGDVDADRVRAWWSLRHLGELRWQAEHDFPIHQSIECLLDLHA